MLLADRSEWSSLVYDVTPPSYNDVITMHVCFYKHLGVLKQSQSHPWE